MPSRKTTSGEFKDVAHPINSAFREVLQKAVLEAYDREIEHLEEQREHGTDMKTDAS
jgi:stage V sporulation protein G